ncbi:MAG: hypothetical protein IPK82_08160 [Polyangiaceae bacterium]|nr:hypothetical protein [Polyangiaceae bacterium]
MTTAHAAEVSGGVSMSAVLIGAEPRIAITPHLSVLWPLEVNFTLAISDFLNVLPAVNMLGVGVYNQTSIRFGYAVQNLDFQIGPSLSAYSTPACNQGYCGRVVGIGPGGQAQVDFYFFGPLGVSVSANVDWVGGRSLVLPGGVAAMIRLGPVLRWNSK